MSAPTVVTVRPAHAGDLPALVAALGEGERHYFAHRLRRQPRLGILLVAERADGAVMGSAFLRLLAAEEWQLRERLRNVPVLSRVEVVEQEQGNGVGTRIVQGAEEQARRHGRRQVVLGVRLGDERALRMYTGLGYEDWGHGPINAIVETFDEQGRRSFGTEPCHILRKAL